MVQKRSFYDFSKFTISHKTLFFTPKIIKIITKKPVFIKWAFFIPTICHKALKSAIFRIIMPKN